IQISETETPLHRLETVYRRLTERLTTATHQPSALRAVIDSWFYTLEEEVLDAGEVDEADAQALARAVDALMEQRLAEVARTTPAFAAALRGYRQARSAGDPATAEALIAWLGGQKSVAAAARRAAGVRGDLDHFAALGFLQGLLTVLRDCGHPGLLVVLDEIETLQRVRGDVREKGLNALRQLLDEIDHGRFPGLFLLITGTPAFYDGQQGAQRLPPLAQRLATDFTTDPRFDSPRAVQLRLSGFDLQRLGELGRTVRDLYAGAAKNPERIAARVDDSYLSELAAAVTGGLGGQVGVAPRIYLRKLVADVLDRVDEFADFDPRRHYALTLSSAELTETERNAASGAGDVDLDLP
ncbi:MAG: BREX system ATP-binding protein BrxD, partial [Pseudonocardiaceae bacterium]